MIGKKRRRSQRVGHQGDCRSALSQGTVQDSDEARRLEAALGTLRHLDREVFLAACIDHLPYAEIARRTGLTKGQVERRFIRTIATLDRALRGVPTRWRWRQHLPGWPF